MKAYVQQVAQEKAQQSDQIQPVQMIFDILQRGQYVSANIVDEVIKAAQNNTPLADTTKNVVQAIWEGITGKRKGSYENVLRNTLGVGTSKLFPGAKQGSWASQLDWAKVLGFAGDVLLDPTTYIGVGASKGAVKAAGEFAGDATKVALKNLGHAIGRNGDRLAELAQKGFKHSYFTQLLDSSPQKAAAYLMRFGGDTSRYLNGVYKDAYKLALRTPAEQLRGTMKKQLEDLAAKETTGADIISNVIAAGSSGAPLKPLDSLDNLVSVLTGKETKTGLEGLQGAADWTTNRLATLENAYQNAGERTNRFMGKEFNTSVRYPGYLRSLDIVKKNISEKLGGSKLGDAFWAVMNKGPVGEIRKAFGFRNPYQKVLRMNELDAGEQTFKYAVNQNISAVGRAVAGYDDQTKQALVKLNDIAEQMWTSDKPVTVFDLLKDPNVLKEHGIADPAKLEELAGKVTDLMSQWQTQYHQFARDGVVSDSKDIVNYLPAVMKQPAKGFRRAGREFGSTTPSFSMGRTYTRLESAQQEAAKLRWAFGIDRAEAQTIVNDLNMGGIEMNLENLLAARAFAQAKIEKRASLVNSFKEFGIPVQDVNTALGQGMLRTGASIPQLGLSSVADPAFNGMLFDRDVAEIINRAVGATNPQNINVFQSGLKAFTNWWRGIVTMTTGFHARNFFSNQMTQFMKHGVRAFNPEDQIAAIAGVAYALRESNPKLLLKQAGIDNATWNRLLNKRYGNFTVRELADEARRKGVISEALYGYDPQELFTKLGQKKTANPLSNRFVGRDVSRKIGEYVENTPRFQSFLMDYGDTAGKVTATADIAQRMAEDQAAIVYASQEAKKWFIDYTDLTQFEQKVMKNVIPFYSWLRKNIANQISAITMYPEIYSMFPKLEQFAKYEDPNYNPSFTPDWMKQLGMFPTGKLEDGTYRMFNPNFPFQDLNKIPLVWQAGHFLPKLTGNELKNDLINAMHPAIKEVASAMTKNGYNFFYQSELGPTSPAPYLFRLFASQPGTLAFLDGFARAAGHRDGIKAHLDQNGKLVMDSRMAMMLQDFMPLLRQVDFLFYGAETAVPGLQEAIQEKTNAKSPYDDIAQRLQVLSYYAGVKFSPLDTEKVKQQIGADIYWTARQRYDAARQQLPGVQQRRLASQQAIQRQQRRLGI